MSAPTVSIAPSEELRLLPEPGDASDGNEAKALDDSDEGSCASFSSSSPLTSDDEQEEGHSAEYSSSDEDEAASDDRNSKLETATARLLILGLVRVTADYVTSDPNELSMTEGETLEVLEMRASGWWRGQRGTSGDDRAILGWFPCTYVEWVSSASDAGTDSGAGFTVKKEHAGSHESELTLYVGDSVRIAASEWRNDSLWARGSTPDGTSGWFPFDSIMDT